MIACSEQASKHLRKSTIRLDEKAELDVNPLISTPAWGWSTTAAFAGTVI